jgi:hypothetical protein
MTPKFKSVLEYAIETGIKIGYARAHKHSDKPDEHIIHRHIEEAVWNELFEWFDFDTEGQHE